MFDDEILLAGERIIKKKQFIILALTGCIANGVGFISNFLLFGMSFPTIACGVCEFLMIIFSFIGLTDEKRIYFSAAAMLLIINLFEFPFLYLVYAKSTMVYLILGIIGIIVFIRQGVRILYIGIIALLDIAIIIYESLFPLNIEQITKESALGATIITFVVVVSSATALLILMLQKYEEQNAALKNLSQELKQMANLDPLTKLYNRRYLTQYIDNIINNKTMFTVALLDLDDFKQVNDEYGHIFGDEVLESFAYILKKYMNNNGIAARFGGEEFMLVFENDDVATIKKVMENVAKDFAEFSMKEKGVKLTFSGGVEVFHHEDRVTQLFNAADEKLYKAKNNGKNNIVV